MGDQAICNLWHTTVPAAFDFPAPTATCSFSTALTERGLWHTTQHQHLNLHFWICSISLNSSDTKPVIRSNNRKEIPWLIWLWWLSGSVLNYLPQIQAKTAVHQLLCAAWLGVIIFGRYLGEVMLRAKVILSLSPLEFSQSVKYYCTPIITNKNYFGVWLII